MSAPGPIEAWRRILEPRFAPLLAELAALPEAGIAPAVLTRLRAAHAAEEVAVAIELVTARRRAARRFRDPERLLCDVAGAEQASGTAPAEHKARRFAGRSGVRILDLCCGIGGDSMALAALGSELLAVDRDPARAWMARHNAGVPVAVADVAHCDSTGAFVHLDPARRRGGRRVWRYEDYEPGPEVIEGLVGAAAGAAVKLGPGIAAGELPAGGARELEFIGGRRGLLQCVMWTGELAQAPGRHTATRLADEDTSPAGRTVPVQSFSGAPAPPPQAAAAGRYLFVPEPALERAGLVAARLSEAGVTGVGELAPGLGILTGDGAPDDPWFDCFEILARMPWRRRRVRDWLAGHGAGVVTVRTRAAAVDPASEQTALRGAGEAAFTVFGLREGRRLVATITRASRAR